MRQKTPKKWRLQRTNRHIKKDLKLAGYPCVL
jgi:hypothetical protein